MIKLKIYYLLLVLLLFSLNSRVMAQLDSTYENPNPYQPVSIEPVIPKGYELKWADEFNQDGKPDDKFWSYEIGFVRNKELQWYQSENANVSKGVLLIEGKKERIENTNYIKGSDNWRQNRKLAEYSSACIKTKDKFSFQYGILEVRARIDTSMGVWPAIWTLGIEKKWPANGEIDLMEFYIHEGEAKLLANAAWADNSNNNPLWDSVKIPFSKFISKDKKWSSKFHVWKMDWTENYIRLYMDDQLLNEIDLKTICNEDEFNPFRQPHYLLLNLAIGANGGNPSETNFPKKYEVDYVRIYQVK